MFAIKGAFLKFLKVSGFVKANILNDICVVDDYIVLIDFN